MKKNRITISLVIPYYHNMFSTFYTLEIIKEASKAAIEDGLNLLVETSWKVFRVSGILFADVMGNELLIKKARAKKVPYLILNYFNLDSKDNCIGIDNEKAGLEAADYLVRSGHKRIAIITGKLNAQAAKQRLEGYKKAMRLSEIVLDKRYIVNGDWTEESGVRAMKKLLSIKERPTAVFAAGDEMALGAMRAAKEAGLKTPEDISFVGFDNIPAAGSPDVSLTTIKQPFPELARAGFKYLQQIIKKQAKQPVKILLENTELIKRGSVKEL